MHASLVRRNLSGLIPPKIATPNHLSSGGSASLAPLVSFYSKLPKGPAPVRGLSGLKARLFNGPNASGAPIVWTIVGVFGLGYFIDYQMHLKHHKNHPH